MSRHGAHEHAVVLPSLKSSAPGCGWQSRLAEEANRQTTEELEREATALAGHAAFILESIDRSQRGGRYIRPEDMVRYVTDFLHERYPGSQIEYEADSTELFSINLSAKARDALGSFIEQRRPGRPTRLAGATIVARFDPNVEGRTRRLTGSSASCKRFWRIS
jgi:hypothetical protein